MTRIGSLCSGYGGLDLGLMAVVGGSVAWHVEHDKHPAAVLDARFPGVPNHGDITTTDWANVEPVDWLTAGYPCQPFSHAGKRKGKDDERHLWPFVADAIGVLRPRNVLLENVRGHVSLGLADVLADLSGLGYDARWGVVRAAEAGAPHGRARIFILATTTEAADTPHSMARGAVRGRGLHHAPPRHEAAPDLAGSVDDGRGRGSAVRIADRGGVGAWPLRAARTGDEADLPLDDHDDIWRGAGSGHAMGWVVLSPPCESHRGDDRSRGLDTPAGAAIVARDAAGHDQRHDGIAGSGGAGAARLAARGTGGIATDTRGERHGGGVHPGRVGCLDREDAGEARQRERSRPVAGDRGGAAATDAASDGRGEGWPEPARLVGRPDAAERGDAPYSGCGCWRWGRYRDAVHRWEVTTGRIAPPPTDEVKGKQRLSVRAVEWMMGLPDGWVTAILPRNPALKALGNGVVPQQAALALRLLGVTAEAVAA